jgi:hypothetical protein
VTNLRWYQLARTTRSFRVGVVGSVVATAVGWTQTSQSLASSELTLGVVNVSGQTPGAPATTGPVVIDVHAKVAADQSGGQPPQLRALGLRMPAGFSIAVAAIPSCDINAAATGGSTACVATSKLGTGKASIAVSGLWNGTVATQELSIFRGTDNKIFAYARITDPKEISVVLPGILESRPPDAPLLKLDLRKILRPAGMRAAITSADITLTQGLQAGPCLTGLWGFRAQLNFVDPVFAFTTTPSVPCAQPPAPEAPASTPPPAPAPLLLRASARKSTRASGARFAISLSAPATINVTLKRRAAKRWIVVRRLSVTRPAGRTSLTIHTAHGRPLPAGRYRSFLQAVDAAGATSAPRFVRFTVR